MFSTLCHQRLASHFFQDACSSTLVAFYWPALAPLVLTDSLAGLCLFQSHMPLLERTSSSTPPSACRMDGRELLWPEKVSKEQQMLAVGDGVGMSQSGKSEHTWV